MNLQNYYYYFQSALTPRICDDIIAYAKQHKPEMAVTGGIEKENGTSRKKDGTYKKTTLKKLHVKRKSDIVWLNDTLGYTKNYIHMFIRQMKKQVGTLNGIGRNLVSLQNMVLVNTMVGIVIAGIDHTINQMILLNMVR